MLAALGILFHMPLYIGFQSQAGGPAINLWSETRIQQYLVMFGPFVFIFIGLLVALGAGLLRRLDQAGDWRPGALVCGGVAAALVTGRWLALLLSLMITFGAFCVWRLLQMSEVEPADAPAIFSLLLMIVGLGLTWAVEFVYLKDTFGTRMNTIFKFYFQAWTLLAIAGAYGVYHVLRPARQRPPARRQACRRGVMCVMPAGVMLSL